jgi:hypothetical protein
MGGVERPERARADPFTPGTRRFSTILVWVIACVSKSAGQFADSVKIGFLLLVLRINTDFENRRRSHVRHLLVLASSAV